MNDEILEQINQYEAINQEREVVKQSSVYPKIRRKKVIAPDYLKLTIEDLDRELEAYRREQKKLEQKNECEETNYGCLMDSPNYCRSAQLAFSKRAVETAFSEGDLRKAALIQYKNSQILTPKSSRSKAFTFRSPTGSILARGSEFISNVFKSTNHNETFDRVFFRK